MKGTKSTWSMRFRETKEIKQNHYVAGWSSTHRFRFASKYDHFFLEIYSSLSRPCFAGDSHVSSMSVTSSHQIPEVVSHLQDLRWYRGDGGGWRGWGLCPWLPSVRWACTNPASHQSIQTTPEASLRSCLSGLQGLPGLLPCSSPPP